MLADKDDTGTDGVFPLAPPFRPEGTSGWIADLPAALHPLTDTNAEPHRSRLRLFEDGQALGPSHAGHESIRRTGRGAHSFWTEVLYFSTSDGSDPNTNGRSYTAVLAPPAAAPGPVGAAPDHVQPEWTRPQRPLRCAFFGLGNRGLGLMQLARSYPGVEIAWVMDRSAQRVREALTLCGHGARGTTDMAVPLADETVDIVFVTVPDHLHRAIAEPAFAAGKHVFLEKPLATTAADAAAILAAWGRSGRVLQLGYVLRQAPFYAAIRETVRKGLLGPVRLATLFEQLDVRHGASFMRRWHASSAQSGGLMVHKGCHDLDIVCWLLDGRPEAVSSFGGTDTFAEPPPAPFCSQCDRRTACPYVDTGLHERRTPEEVADPSAYGLDRCVFHTDKDIVDNQVVSFVLDTGVRGTFHLCVQGPVRTERRITLIGDRARLDGVFEDGTFTVTYTDRAQPGFVWTADGRSHGSHGGGDRVTMLEFLNACVGRSPAPIVSVEEALRGLVFALAAERARTGEKVVRLEASDFALVS
ncbi:Gfo/Idh/MocA family protein [Reyranella sp.]|uniref:Gfo/Idh/MocA family protein n=1 Tax=Reyranella sp. TaxID=1929291 RepID=UPI003BAA3ABB